MLPPPCFVPSDTNFRISLRDRTLALRTDKSSPSPGGSSSAKRSDLAAGPTCSARTAPRYGEAPPMIWSRRTFEVLVAPQKDQSLCDVRRPDLSRGSGRGHSGFEARHTCETCLKSSRGSRRWILRPCLVAFDANFRISPHL